jgi:hypothetical protein
VTPAAIATARSPVSGALGLFRRKRISARSSAKSRIERAVRSAKLSARDRQPPNAVVHGAYTTRNYTASIMLQP